MNEVTNMQMAARLGNNPVVSAASSKGAATANTQETRGTSGNTLPVIAENPVGKVVENAEQTRQTVEAAVASINDFVQSVQRDLHFSVDEELNRTIIKVLDAGTGDLIRQIPEEVFLELARKLKDDGEFQLVNALG